MEMMSGAAWVEQLQAGGWTVHAATFADRELKKRLRRRMHYAAFVLFNQAMADHLGLHPYLRTYAAAREDKLAHKPASLSFEQAAVVPVSALAAIHGLRDAVRVEAGQKVLIVGASGGVGTYAVQLAKAFGAEVTGVCSIAKVDLVRSIGADHVVDYAREDFADGVQRYDLILDIGGNSRLSRLRRALTPKGTLVIVGGDAGGKWTGGIDRQIRALALSLFVRQRLTTFISKEHHADLEPLTQFIEAGHVAPVIDRTYPLAEVPDAMRHLEAGHARGKIAAAVWSVESSNPSPSAVAAGFCPIYSP